MQPKNIAADWIVSSSILIFDLESLKIPKGDKEPLTKERPKDKTKKLLEFLKFLRHFNLHNGRLHGLKSETCVIGFTATV